MYIYYNKGQVKFISTKKQGTDLKYITKTLTQSEKEKINSGEYEVKVENNKLKFQEKIETIKKKNIKKLVENAKTVEELKSIILNLI